MSRRSRAFCLFIIAMASTAPTLLAVNFNNNGGTSVWSDPNNWSTGVLPGPTDDIWVDTSGDPGDGLPVTIVYDAANINPGTPDEGISTVGFFRLGNGTFDHNFEMLDGRLNITNYGGQSWSSRWSSSNDFTVGGTGVVDVTNTGNPGVTEPSLSAFGIGFAGSTLDNRMLIRDNGEVYVRDGGAAPDPQNAPGAGDFYVGAWRGSNNYLTVQDNGRLDIARSLTNGDGSMFYEQSGGTVNIGWDFYLDIASEYFDDGNTIFSDRSQGTVSGGMLNVANNFHVVGWGAGDFTVRDAGRVDVGGVMKVNIMAVEPEDRASILDVTTDDANLNVLDGGEVAASFWEVPTAAQMVNDEAHLNVEGGLVVVRDSFLELGPTFAPLPIVDPAAAFTDWVNSGYLTGALSPTSNADPGVAPLVKVGDLALGRGRRDSDPVDANYWFIWTTAEEPGISGDFNGDGNWDCQDIDALTAAVATASSDLAFDMNGDGSVDVNDITDPASGWLAVGGSNNPSQTGGNAFLPGDANLDGSVDVSDFNVWNANKFSALPAWCSGDFSSDGSIDVSDFNIWNGAKFQSSSNGGVVPEPSSIMGLLVMAGLLALNSRRRV